MHNYYRIEDCETITRFYTVYNNHLEEISEI